MKIKTSEGNKKWASVLLGVFVLLPLLLGNSFDNGDNASSLNQSSGETEWGSEDNSQTGVSDSEGIQEIVDRIEMGLRKSDTFSFETPTVDVVSLEGEITLSGKLRDDESKEELESLVRNIDQVKSVNNEINL